MDNKEVIAKLRHMSKEINAECPENLITFDIDPPVYESGEFLLQIKNSIDCLIDNLEM